MTLARQRPLAFQRAPAPISGRPEQFHIEVRPDRDRVLVMPCGELDLATTPAVEAAIDELVAGGFEAIVVDLRGTSFLDSTGLRLMIAQTTREDAHVTLIDGPPAVSRLFDVTGMRDSLPFEPSP